MTFDTCIFMGGLVRGMPALEASRVDRSFRVQYRAHVQLDVNGARLWFHVDGPALVPDGAEMRPRPTLVLLHGGPGGYDHSSIRDTQAMDLDGIRVARGLHRRSHSHEAGVGKAKGPHRS